MNLGLDYKGSPRSMSSADGNYDHDVIASLQRQKAAIATFGIEAFRSTDLDELLTKAVQLVGEGLAVERTKVLELVAPGDRLLIRAGVGWELGVVGTATIGAGLDSPAGFALRTGEPVVSADLMNDRRFRCPAVLREHGIKSAVNVIIGGAVEPFGVLEVDSQSARQFSTDDVNFVQGYANLLAAAIDRVRTHRELAEIGRDRATLLHELQHRVKNSLQVIASFISLQRRETESPAARDELDVIAGRIEALRVVYAKLYLADRHGETDLCAYLRDLCASLLRFQLADGKAISLEVQCETLNIDLDQAVALGLFATEFVVNSLKHAFPDGRGALTVRLDAGQDGRARLVLADSGSGQAVPRAIGSGLGLMEQLAVQAGARLSWQREGGTRAELVFAPARS